MTSHRPSPKNNPRHRLLTVVAFRVNAWIYKSWRTFFYRKATAPLLFSFFSIFNFSEKKKRHTDTIESLILSPYPQYSQYPQYPQRIRWLYVFFGVMVIGFSVGAIFLRPLNQLSQAFFTKHYVPVTPQTRVLSQSGPYSKTVIVSAGQNMRSLLMALGMNSDKALQTLSMGQSHRAWREFIHAIKPAQQVTAHFDVDGRLDWLDINTSANESAKSVTRLLINPIHHDGSIAANTSMQLMRYTPPALWVDHFGSATITTTLFDSAANAGIAPSVITNMAAIFGSEVDFFRTSFVGFQWKVHYRQKWINGVATDHTHIMAVSMQPSDLAMPPWQAFAFAIPTAKPEHTTPYQENDHNFLYYNEKAQSWQPRFLKNPLVYTPALSQVQPRFFQPFQSLPAGGLQKTKGKIGAYVLLGHMFSAPIGTAVWATGDGVIKTLGVDTGQAKDLGNTVIIRHGQDMETVYGYLGQIQPTLKRGDKIEKGEVIGYLGTPLASETTEHSQLYYEFRIGGRPNDVLSAKSMPSKALMGRHKVLFDNQLEHHRQSLRIAAESVRARFE